MKKTLLFFSIFLIITSLRAEDKSDHHSHHGHAKGLGAHEHGAIKLEIAVTDKMIEIDLDGPSESFIGFEYTPTSEKEKKIFKDAESLWTKELLTKLFVLDKSLGCTSSAVSFKQEINKNTSNDKKKNSGIHSEIEAKATITCNQNLSGKSIFVSVKMYYPGIKKLSIDIIGNKTMSIKAKATEEIKL